MLSKSVLAAGQRVRLPSGLSSFCLGLVSLLVGHCARLVSLLFPSFFLLVSLLVSHCVRLVSLLFPLVSLRQYMAPNVYSKYTLQQEEIRMAPARSSQQTTVGKGSRSFGSDECLISRIFLMYPQG